ncbi:cytochrome c oxidase accessory protein CcoG [Afifella aestuarii]|uniref:cytochrome c oxidase accessory protein CcoG n=1 Tax=Afifella aestuarii TaxID=1909496 RepID=UPI001FEAB1A6|nr:cytochrome c oxidase accessory protein CcoG [Afifella aestuarii]
MAKMNQDTYAGGGVVDQVEADPVNSRNERSLYAARLKIFPQKVSGAFRRLKWLIMFVTLGIYWVTPWIRWDRGPNAPDQAVLVDLASRRFYFFSIEIWPQEFYYVAGLLIMAGLGLFLITSVVGRAWCGYTCPQTVWTDLYMAVERRIIGDRNAQMRLDKAPWGFAKIRKIATVHAIWLLIAIATGGAWVFYFADAPGLAVDLVTLKAPPAAYVTIAVLTFTTYVFAGFMREQVCTYMCPWPRIQGAMLDEDSLIVTYNDWRGEPRSRHRKKSEQQGLDTGDCVDCNACVAVCPMGIDIRDGQQLECITCALCIDACNNIMDKVNKPRGLISYSTLQDYQVHAAAAVSKGREVAKEEQRRFSVSHIVRPRTVIYFTLWSLIGVAMLVTLAMRDRLDINVLHERNPLFVTLSDGSVRNTYTVKLLNMLPELKTFSVTLDGLPGAEMWYAGAEEEKSRNLIVEVQPDRVRDLRVFVVMPEGARGSQDFDFVVTDPETGQTSSADAQFHGPTR